MIRVLPHDIINKMNGDELRNHLNKVQEIAVLEADILMQEREIVHETEEVLKRTNEVMSAYSRLKLKERDLQVVTHEIFEKHDVRKTCWKQEAEEDG